jgi:tetratricopeptide (TPR) repeat protein
MLKENKMTQAEYDERYSDVAALRCWVYLQLSNLFGKVPYITEPIISLEDLDKYKQNTLNPDELIKELIRCMESLPTLENYRLSKLISGTIDGYSLTPFFIDKKCLLGDLYLFNNDYDKAARIYREIMAIGETEAATSRNNFRKYRLYCDVWRVSDGTPNWFQILYALDKNDDADAFYNAWRRMFLASTTNTYDMEEMIWFVSYDTKFAPDYTLPQLFNPAGYNKGKGYLKSSDYAVEAIWGNEMQKNGYPFDARGLTGAYEKGADGNYYIRKYSYMEEGYVGGVCGSWFLYRAAMLHLRYAEAANRAGYPLLAWALVNDGIHGAAFTWKKEDGSAYPGDSIQYSSYGPGHPYPEPYYFDGRLVDQPYIRAPWRYNGGVRGRANLPNVPFPDNLTTKQDSILFVEKLIIREAALELGFEGNRWGDLVRIARRLNKETPGAGIRFLWNENIAKKFIRSGVAAPDMSSEEKWYLPLYE